MFSFEEYLKQGGVENDIPIEEDFSTEFVFIPNNDSIPINPKTTKQQNVKDVPVKDNSIMKCNQSIKSIENNKDNYVSVITASCAICFGKFLPYEGYTCNNIITTDNNISTQNSTICKIFTCWTCMNDNLEVACKSIENVGMINREGHILCCHPKCRTAITFEKLFYTSAPMNIIKSQQELQYKIKLQLALSEQNASIYKEYKRIENIHDQNEKMAAKLRYQIIEEILTLKCPGCNQAFQDFDGCFALTCSRVTCGTHFCAWCLCNCGTDAHHHVSNCIENTTNSVHGSFEIFNEHHRKRKLKNTKIMIENANLNTNARKFLYEMLAGDLRDLGISEYDVFPEQRNARN